MKIGILTFHSQLNYGAILQAYAMQCVYKELGHNPIIIDRWLDRDSPVLSWRGGKSVKVWVKDMFLFVCGVGVFSRYVRYWKTIRFFKRSFKLTSYYFHDWKDAPKDLGVDLISVGSDQVWNARLFPVAPYLLEGAPADVPAISYAASFGMPEIPAELLEFYLTRFKRFRFISARELEGVRLLSNLNIKAQHVVDPTLLVGSSVWEGCVGVGQRKERKLVVYVLAENVWNMLPVLEMFAKRNACAVTLLVDGFGKRFGRDVKSIVCCLSAKLRLLRSPIRIFAAAGPIDFVREIWSANWIVANSYHALMFAIIFRRQIRIIMPHDMTRKGMHARMAEFSGTVVNGPLMQQSLENALLSIEHGDKIYFNESMLKKRIEDSKLWLKSALESFRMN